MYGSSVPCTTLDCPIARPTGTPMSTAAAKPSPITVALATTCGQIDPSATMPMKRRMISEGLLKNSGSMRPACSAASQVPKTMNAVTNRQDPYSTVRRH